MLTRSHDEVVRFAGLLMHHEADEDNPALKNIYIYIYRSTIQITILVRSSNCNKMIVMFIIFPRSIENLGNPESEEQQGFALFVFRWIFRG